MPLNDNDLTLVTRGEANANATLKQVKDYVLDGLSSSEELVWVDANPTDKSQISATKETIDARQWFFPNLVDIKVPIRSLGEYEIGDVIILMNLATGGSGTYRVTFLNQNTSALEVDVLANSHEELIVAGDRFVVVNLGKDFTGDTVIQGATVWISDVSPTVAVEADLWYQPVTGAFFIYHATTDAEGNVDIWKQLNNLDAVAYDNGPYYKNAVHDWGIDNTGTTVDQSPKIKAALEHLFNHARQNPEEYEEGEPADPNRQNFPVSTLYFPAGIYRIGTEIILDGVGVPERAGFVIKGDGMSTKFYVGGATEDLNGNAITEDPTGGITIKFAQKDNYLTVQDLAIHPKAQINGRGLYLQNGNDDVAANPPDVDTDDNDFQNLPSGGSNQQYGCQIINVNILSDEDKPNTEQEKKDEFFFNFPLSLINFGRPRLSRVICWNHAERSNYSFANPTGIDYSDNYGFKPEETGTVLNLSNCYSPWIDNCYFNGTAKYGIFWNSTRNNTEGGTLTKLVINGADIGCWVAQNKGDGSQGRHPHFTLIDSHINSAQYGLAMNNVKYFHIADVLFYSRNDRIIDSLLIDCFLTDCHSGILSNGYSGGVLGGSNEDKDIPQNIDFRPNSLPAEDRDQAKADIKAKAPKRIHVLLQSTYNRRPDGSIIRNRNILVKDTKLNAYLAQTNAQNKTLGQFHNGRLLTKNDVEWYSPYVVTGECSDVHIDLPPAAYNGHPDGQFDSTQYPA